MVVLSGKSLLIESVVSGQTALKEIREINERMIALVMAPRTLGRARMLFNYALQLRVLWARYEKEEKCL